MYDESELLEDIRHIRHQPNMWMRRGTFDDTCALIHGMDIGTNGRLLDGFQQWLAKQLNLSCDDIPWWNLSLMVTFQDEKFVPSNVLIPDESQARTALIDQVEKFLLERKNRVMELN
ncbi:MAG: hypothetical protein Q4D98_13935 [Planctomycetia bacterium]|nr:hypothetical protein [Planctomycetia bacterium]